MANKRSFIVFLAFAVISGLIIAWIDSRPGWDDAGISAGMILLAGALWGYLASQKPWLIALSVGIWIPLFGIINGFHFEGLLALIPAFIGAYAGYFTKRFVSG
jgi:hypothetical protein